MKSGNVGEEMTREIWEKRLWKVTTLGRNLKRRHSENGRGADAGRYGCELGWWVE